MVSLSYAQRRLWFIDQSSGPSIAYNIPRIFRISGPLDQEALAAALIDVVERHDALRTVFPQLDGDVRQWVVDVGRQSRLLQDMKITESELATAISVEVARPFKLAEDLPIRAVLFELDEGEYRLLLILHHIAMDVWSYGLLLRDLATAYFCRRKGRAPRFDPLAARYADYALWQQEMVGHPGDESSLAARQLEFWRRQLTGAPEILDLPYDRARPDVADHRGGAVDFHVGTETHSRLAALASSTNSSTFMVCQAALAAWLSCLGAGADIPIGTAHAGRDDAAFEELVGLFINTLVLRIDLSGDPAFKDLVRQVRQTTLAAFDHSAVPFDQVVESVNPTRSPGWNPIFQVMSNWHEHQGDDGGLTLDGVQVEAIPVNNGTARFDLSVFFAEHKVDGLPAGISAKIVYDVNLFDRDTVQSMANLFVGLLEVVARDPGRRLSKIDLVGPEERELVLRTWNDSKTALAATNLPEMFSAQVRRTPNAVALETADETLTYAELNSRANQLTHLLIQHGAGPETYVAVIVPRVTALIAMLAVLKAGATFLPIDPEYPRDRISYILDDARPSLIVTVAQLDTDLGDRESVVLDRPDIVAALERCPKTDPGDGDRLTPLRLNSPAYIIYTSGSTGRPKGVVVTAKVLINLLSWQIETMATRPGTRVSQFSAISFDAFEQEILAALFTGQTVVIPSEDVRRDPTALVSWLNHREINEFLAPDIVVRSVLEAATEQGVRLDHLSTLIQGGEPFQLTDPVREFRRRHPGIAAYNHYGPSETHVITSLRLPDDPLRWPAVAPIGKPIWNCQTYVLDAHLRPVPVGVAGELYLAGAGLARGYLRRPGLTSQRFVANPFGASGERMYRTGDVVRWNRRGELVIVGRADDQIKIRGIRVELNEINSVLCRHPQVAQAATVVREDASGDKRLITYVVPAAPYHPAASELRRHAAALLPAAIVPSAFVTLDVLPLNSNGKLNRQALPAPDFAAQSSPGGRAPRTPVEKTLCEVFGEVLGASLVSVDDNFFDMGGHSMLVVRLVKQVRAALGVELGIRTVFEHSTVAALAEAVESSTDRQSRRALGPMPRPDRLPLSFAQQRLWFIDQLEGPSSQYTLGLMKLRMVGRLDLGALEAALTDVVLRHESLRTIFPDVDGKPFQRILPAQEVSVSVEYSQVEPGDLEERVARACGYEFDLATELLVRAEILSLSSEEHVFVLVAHHIVSDGWSVAPLCRDLAAAYTARLQGREPNFVPLPVQYADFSLWQREMLGREDDPGSILASQSAMWRRTLAGLPEVLKLPADRPRPDEVSARGAAVNFTLDADLYSRVKSLARVEGATPFMVIQAGLVALLTRLGVGSDIPLGVTVAGRSEALLDELVGCFINILILRSDTSGDPSFRELLGRTRETDLQAFQNQDLPFERLVEILKPARSRSHNPLFQIMMTMQTGGARLELPGLQVDQLSINTASTSMFDLTIGLVEVSEAGSLSGVIQYATDLFDRHTVDTLAARLEALLDSASSQPDMKIGSLDIAATGSETLEAELCELFADVLGIDAVSVDDDFFDLGGHSLLAAELVGRVRSKYRVKLKLRRFFFGPTVAQLSEVISRQR